MAIDYYELLKAAHTGIFPADASFYDRKRAQAIRRSMERKRKERQQDEGTESNSAHPSEGSPETGQPLKGVGKSDSL